MKEAVEIFLMLVVVVVLVALIWETAQFTATQKDAKTAMVEALRENEKKAGFMGSDYRASYKFYKEGVLDVAKKLGIRIKPEEYK
ncbi:hypothetical protein [Adhaeribacter aquaticus]|uniref:hypothetical protein n=1 Tax=Adhaeribacter aquaticus TaxID=299567 RepID=UPI00042839B9|nr:hypothetical protein [Adhaeribacter aquaticus]